MTFKQSEMAEELYGYGLTNEQDELFILNIIRENRDLSDEENNRLIKLYDEEFGYGYEDSND